ncbi:MAG TPA: transporter, partial [Gammaproteobacteria bacterium]|nr:transporter [Gammaproteobacteria bacterium]
MLWSSTIATSARSSELNLREAIRLAITDDPWLVGSDYRERALRSEAISARSLPDPSISLQAANFPTDNFDFGQEPMTQVSVSVGQRLPRGNSLQLAADRKRAQAGEEPFLRQDRQARVTDRVTQLWLEAFVAQESIRLIQEDRALFENLADATRASYSTAVKRSRQQEVIRAQVELVWLGGWLNN